MWVTQDPARSVAPAAQGSGATQMEGAPNLRRQGFHPQRPWELGSCVSVRLAFGGGGYRLPRYSENCGPDGEARSQGLEAGAWRAEAGLPRTWGTDRAVQTCFCTQDFGVTGTRLLRGTRLPDPLGVQVVASSGAMLSVPGPQGQAPRPSECGPYCPYYWGTRSPVLQSNRAPIILATEHLRGRVTEVTPVLQGMGFSLLVLDASGAPGCRPQLSSSAEWGAVL